MRLYFKGESLKRKDADYCTIQASSDEDNDVLRGFAESALNEVSQAVVKRMSSFDWEIGTPDKEPETGTSDEKSDAPGGTSGTISETTEEITEEGSEKVTEDTTEEVTKGASKEEYITITFVPYERMTTEDESRMCKIVRRAIFDYLANFVMGEWLETVNPEVSRSVVDKNDGLLFKVRRAFAGLSGMVRRRATDLAGI